MSEFDSPWKEALECYLRWFLLFFFPDIADSIDWDRGYESLDKELEQLVREGEMGKRLADKLFKVWHKDGAEAWVLIHTEVQAQPELDFPERMYVYNYRIFDRFRRPVASLAVLGDERESWRPTEYRAELWGSEVSLRFRTVKLLDYKSDLAALENNPNPFALIVLAHLQSQATRDMPANRCTWKVRIIKALLERGMEAEDVRQMFRFIDWLLELPEELEIQFDEEIREYTREKNMPYISALERRAMEKGREEGREVVLEGIELFLKSKFGDEGSNLIPPLREVKDLEKLRKLQQRIITAKSLEDLQRAISGEETADDYNL